MDQISRLGLDMDTAGLMRGAQAADRVAQSMDRAEREAGQLENRTRRVAGQMSVLGGAAQQLGAQLAAAFSVWAVVRANDAWVSATNQIRLVTQSTAELRNITQEVFDLSQRTASRFEAMTGLYASIQRAAGDAIGSTREVLRITETIAKLASASGGPEASRNAALFQLRQMLQGSVVQAQEFNSLIDGTPLLVQAIADSIGVTRGELRRMVLDGNLATSQVIAALQEQADEADAIFSQVAFTMADAFTRIQNAFQKLVGTNLGPVFAVFVNVISTVAENLDALIPVIAGVGAAFAVAFAPTIVLGFAAAIGSLFALIAAHPIAALVGALVAAGAAMVQFGDQVIVGAASFKRIREEGEDAAARVSDAWGKATDDIRDKVDITLRDFAVAAFLEVRDATVATFASVGDAIADMFSDTAAEQDSFWTDRLDNVKAFANFVIGAFATIVDAARINMPRVGDAIMVAFTEGANAAIGALETLLNHMQRLTNPIGAALGARIELPRLDVAADAMERLSRAGDEFGAAMQRNFSTDYIGNIYETVMARAAELALARQAATDQAAAEAEANAAATAAAGAASRNADALAKQIAARQALFDELEAQLRLNEREFEIYQETEDLLRQFPDYYRTIAAGAEDIAAAARDAAEQDARRLDTLRRQIAAQQSLKQLARDEANTTALIEAARQGADALELEERTLDLLDEHADLYEQIGKGAEAAARAEAARQIAAERTLDALTAQAERAREIAEAPAVNLLEGLQNATDDFWTAFVDKGFGAFDDLGDALKNVFKRLQADILRAIFDPITNGITQSVAGLFNGSGATGGFNFGSIFGGASSGGGGLFGGLGRVIFGGSGTAGAGGIGGLGGLGGLGNVLGSIFGGSSASTVFVPGVAAANAAWSAQSLLGGLAQGIGLGSIGGAISGLFGIGGGSGIGSSIGGMVGSIFGPIGSVVGGFLGDAIEGLFGDEEHDWAMVNMSSASSRGGVFGTKSTEGSRSAADQIGDRIIQGQGLLEQMGATLGTYVDFIQFAGNARGGYTLAGNSTLFRTAEGDPNALVNGALNAVLKQSTFADPALERLRGLLTSDSSRSFEDNLDVLGKVAAVLEPVEELTSEWGKALEQLTDTFDELRTSTSGIAGAAAELDAAFNLAKDRLGERFAQSIEDAITAIENPLELQLRELLKVQGTRLADATALGTDVSRVMHLNELELLKFIEAAGGSADAFENLNAIFADLIAQAEAAGQATAPLVDAYNQARGGIVDAFDKSVADQFAQLTNPTLAALRQLLDAQKSRLDQARAIGANIIAVERLNALEQKAFFESLTADQKAALGDYLGLIEDFTGRIAVVLGQLQDELGTRIDQTEQMRSDLLRQSDTMRQLTENLVSLRQGIVDRYGAISPMAGVEALRERFASLAEEARGGNDSALQALGQVGQQLIEASRSLYGSTTTFRGDYDLVTHVLEEAAALAGDRADALQSQAETLLQQRDLLIEIRDILNSPDPSLSLLDEHLDALDENQDVIAALLRQYLQLQAQQSAQQIDMGALIGSATQAAQTPPLPTSTATQTQTPVNPAATPTSPTGSSSPTGAGAQANDATAQMVAVSVDVMQQGFERMADNQERTNRELRNLNDRLGVGSAA